VDRGYGKSVLNVLENLGAGVTKAGLKDIFAFVALILILMFKPHGIIGGGGQSSIEEG
jgi:branched-subunit amino acid ABC-type transport system permease component